MGRAVQLDDQAVCRGQIIHVNGLAGHKLHGILFAECFVDVFIRHPPVLLFPGEEILDAPQLALVAGAAAEVAREIFLDLVLSGVFLFPEEGEGVHNKTRVAEAALLRTLIGDKSTELSSLLLQALQRGHPVAVGTGCQHRAGQHRHVIQKDGAQAAVGGLTAALDAVTAVCADKVDEQGVRCGLCRDFGSVQNNIHLHLVSPVPFQFQHSALDQHPGQMIAVFRTAAHVALRPDVCPHLSGKAGSGQLRRFGGIGLQGI